MNVFDTIAQHMKDVERAISGMHADAAFGFALACTERQWPVLQQACDRSPSMQSVSLALRHALDAAWEHVKDATSLPPGLAARCRREISEADDFMEAITRTIANSIVDLLDAIEKHEFRYAHRLSYRNFDLLELLLDERGVLLNDLKEDSSQDPSEVAAVRDLIDQEILRQTRDVHSLRKDSCAAGIEDARQASVGRSLFGVCRGWSDGEPLR